MIVDMTEVNSNRVWWLLSRTQNTFDSISEQFQWLINQMQKNLNSKCTVNNLKMQGEKIQKQNYASNQECENITTCNSNQYNQSW